MAQNGNKPTIFQANLIFGSLDLQKVTYLPWLQG